MSKTTTIPDALINAPRLTLTERQLHDLEMLMVGGFAPLTGFLNEDDYLGVVKDMRLVSGALWPIPVVLDVSGGYAVGDSLILTDSFGTPLAYMKIESVYQPDKQVEALSVYGTDDLTHPGVRYLFEQTHDTYLGGTITPLSMPVRDDFAEFRYTPESLKAYFKEKGISTVVGFQTRNPVHRAHFELMKHAGEKFNAHVLLHPVVGPTKDDDIDYKTRVRSYRHLHESRMQDFATLALLPLAMRMAGPREALWHALIRKNYGVTHFIVGRDHAGPGKNKDGEPFYGLFDAEALVTNHADELGMTIIPGREMVYVEELDSFMPREEVEAGHTPKTISGTEVRRMLRTNEPIPEWFSFPETVEELRLGILREQKRGVVIFFTGLSGAGKSTIARKLVSVLEERGKTVSLLDGDVVRHHLSKGLGFSREDRNENITRIGFVAAEIAKHGGVAVCSAIAPYEEGRAKNRMLIEKSGSSYIEVFVATPLSVCQERDVKGLYQKARQGMLKNFTGLDDPYEIPSRPELIIDTSDATPDEGVEAIIDTLTRRGLL